MQHTYEMLHQGATFNILDDISKIEDEALVRMIENEYIQYFINNTDFNVVNKKENAYSLKEKKEKYKTLKIKESKYKQAIQLLVYNGLLDIKDNTPTDNYIFNSIIEKFDTKNMLF